MGSALLALLGGAGEGMAAEDKRQQEQKMQALQMLATLRPMGARLAQSGDAPTMQGMDLPGAGRVVIDPNLDSEAVFARHAKAQQDAELTKARALKTDEDARKATDFEATNRAHFSVLSRPGAPLAGQKYEDVAHMDLSALTPGYLQSLSQAAAERRTQEQIAATNNRDDQIVDGVDPKTGAATKYRYNKATHQLEPLAIVPLPKGAGGSASGAQSSLVDMIAQHERQTALENTPGFSVSRGGQVVEGSQYGAARGAAHGTGPSLGQTIGLAAGGLGLGPNAQEKSYLTSGRAFGDEAAKAFKGRQNEEAVLREVATLTATPDDTPETVKQKQARRAAIISMALAENPQMAASLSPAMVAKYAPQMRATGPAKPDVAARAAAIKAKYGIAP